ncbi:zinc finger MYM-type protein 3-like [Diadema antillarum]|uniref:zinc finger MYM-type protein 3-like n=1 Tax=Diadema antillarum TaxID=105358 RepID=UPI003A8420A1
MSQTGDAPSDPSARDSAAVDPSAAESLVSSIQSDDLAIKREMLDDVLGDSSGTDTPRPTSVHTDTPHPDHEVDVKPNLEELDKVVQEASSKDSPVDGPEAVAMQGKQAESRRNKGSSITSIVGRLFKTKQEEEARKKMECPPEESHDQPGSDQIANVPIKISGVKSLAPTSLASARQQRQEKRQASMDFVISNVTSLATGVEKCSKCEKEIKSDEISYTWQSEKFCCFPCLEEKREVSSKTIDCDSCSAVIHPRARHAFFRKGDRELREFCSADCMEKSEKTPKMCPGCGKDVANQANSILAQVGPEGEFFEFCKQECVNSYEESIINDENKEPEISFVKRFSKASCSECGLVEMVRYEFCYREKTRSYCSEACFDAFRMKHNIKIRRCAECNCMCFSDTSNGLVVATGKQTRYFCTQKCKTAGLKPCSNCTVLQPWKDMLRREPNSWEFLCSQSCLDQRKKKRDIPPMQPLQPMTQVSSNTNSSRPRSPPNLRSRTATTASSTDTSTPQQKMSQLQSQGKKVQCDHCGRHQKPLYHLTMSDHTLRNFCCYNCVISYQGKFNVPPVTLPQETLLLRCHQCQRGFNSRPFVLDYEDKTSLFCGKKCIEDFKRTKCVSMICDQCHQDKILYEETYFCGEARSFCSEGCKLLFKQEIVEKLGLQCIVCDYCAQMCQQSSQERFDGNLCYFCSPACKEKYGLWFFKAAKCDGCKKMGTDLTESFKWRGEMKRVCNQQCLLLFYTQQDTPNVSTQLPESIPTSTADHATPTIAKVMSYTPVEKLGPARTYITEPKKPSSDKQTQITTNTVYIKPPPPPPSLLPPGPKMVRNKITSCKPINITKATMCRPFVKDMCVGTDFPKVPAMVPIPVPIFVPVPMQMYKMPVPHPVCVPVPVPTPVFIPVAARDCDRLMSTLEQIKARVPSDPLEAELFMMAAAAAGESESGPDSREEDIGRDGHRGSSREPPKMSLVDQAVKECGLLDEVMDDVGVDELLASLSSPDVADDILLLDDDDDDNESQEERENRRLEEELTDKLRNLGDIPESEGVPPPPIATPRIKRIILKKKRRKRGVKRSKRPKEVKGGGPQQASQDPSLPLRRSSRSTKKTKYFSAGEESQEEVDEDEEYQPEESSSDEEIVEMEDEISQEDAPPPKPMGPPPIDESWVTAGQAAYSLFVHRHNKGVKTPAMRLQASILECPTDMLHRGLIMFVRHARRPDIDEPYPPETMFLLCLSIQHLVTNSGRMENFFVGPNFEQFRLCLHQTLESWAPRLHPQSGLLLNSRITEEMMWSAQQLGAHSPQVLLSTIFFFNCKNLAMNTVQEHSEVAFFRMQKHVKKTGPGRERAYVIRYFPPKKKSDEDSSEAPGPSRRKKEQVLERLDQSENTENVLRCPVKLYEFYLSKCPEAVKMRNQVLYLLPEHSCVPDSPVWYSATKLPDEEMSHMLHRYAMIHEVQTAWRLKEEKLAKEKDAAPPPSSSSHQSQDAAEESATPIETTVPGQESGTQI